METAKLPDKPSELIRVALADLRKVEAMPDVYKIDMGDWHAVDDDSNHCFVCLAGSVMAQTLKVDAGSNCEPWDFDEVTCGKLEALNEFRAGCVRAGLSCLDVENGPSVDDREMARYADNPEAFHRDMQTLASDLEAVGL